MAVFLVARFVFTFLMRYIQPSSCCCSWPPCWPCVLNLVVMFSPNLVGAWALVLVSFSMSLMFPTIYGIALHGLGADTKFGGAGLVMAILGGAILPVVQGGLMDAIGAPLSFGLMVICFAIIAGYAWFEVKYGDTPTEIKMTGGH